MVFLGAEAGFPVIDLSVFHRYLDDTFQADLDGVRFVGQKSSEGEVCMRLK